MSPTATFQSTTIPKDRLLPGIHGLRGISALAVVLFHLVHLANIATPSAFTFIARDFGKGVHLFFVLSAFSLMYSTEHTLSRPTWANEYFVKRFFRIAPLYYFIMASMILWLSIKSQTPIVSLNALLLNLTFTFGFAPWTGIVWAGWTVGVEMLFYAVLPILMLTIRSSMGTLLMVVASILVSYAARAILQEHYDNTVLIYRYNWAYFSFPSNLCYFVIGIYAYRISREIDEVSRVMRWGLPMFTTALLGILLFMGSSGDFIIWGFAFAALSLWQCKLPSRWSANNFFVHVGERSYSVYLLHPIVLILLKSPLQVVYQFLIPSIGAYAYFACAALVMLPLLMLAEITYRLIEVPGISYGQRINASKRKQANPLDSGSRDDLPANFPT